MASKLLEDILVSPIAVIFPSFHAFILSFIVLLNPQIDSPLIAAQTLHIWRWNLWANALDLDVFSWEWNVMEEGKCTRKLVVWPILSAACNVSYRINHHSSIRPKSMAHMVWSGSRNFRQSPSQDNGCRYAKGEDWTTVCSDQQARSTCVDFMHSSSDGGRTWVVQNK